MARSACASLNGARAEIGSIVYSGALLAFVRDWLYLPEGRLACEAAVPSWLPGWLNLLLAETNSAHVPSIEFMKPIRSAIESCETDLSRYVGAAELQQWESEFPIIRSVFAKNLKHLQSLQDRQSADAARVETAKLVAMKELAYGASHEINNPLANISTRAQLLMKDEPDDDRKRQLATITRQAYRAHEMISDLMLFAKPPKIEKSSFDLKDFFDRLTSSLESDVELRSAVITFDVAEPLEIAADAQQLEVALRSIIKNSIEASDTSCAISIKCRLSDMSARSLDRHADRFVEIEIADDGPGVSPEVRRHLFDPFYSGREAGRGLGFGLSKAWRIVEQHGGQIIVDSPNNGGLTLTMRIPME